MFGRSRAAPRPWRSIVAKARREAGAIWRRDGWLIVGLVLAVLVGFEGSVRKAFQFARQVELSYGLALLPALFILCALLAFHQYTKRQELKRQAAAAAAEAAQVKQRLLELERLAAFGHALAGCLGFDTLQQVVWRHLPGFIGRSEAWLLTYNEGTWRVLADTTGLESDRSSQLQAIAVEALSRGSEATGCADGIECAGAVCFPMIVGGQVVGVLGLDDAPTATPGCRRAMSAVATMLGIAARNVQLFRDVRDDALHDRLTGCLGRAHGLETLSRELVRVARMRRPVSIVMFDIDYFKAINDRYGHLVGDEVLSAVGERLRSLLRGSDTRCRYGGDEFLVILPETPAEGAVHVAEWLRMQLAAVRVPSLADASTPLRVSLGVATTDGRLEVEEMIARADAALYEAKRCGRNCVRSYKASEEPFELGEAV
ncbi:MAG: GGDEF domain-containing protein [Acidobacteria bacterium]|nr:GGDEF domain-containing protein [Acidobacteriota bacterium]